MWRVVNEGNRRFVLLEFRSMFDLLDYIDDDNAPSPKNGFDRSSSTNTKDFTGTYSYREAIDIARNGYPEGAAKLSDVPDIDFRIFCSDKTARTHTNSVCGGVVSVPRYISNHPLCFRTIKRSKIKSKIIDLVSIGSDNCNISADTLSQRGKMVINVCKYIEKLGYRVNIHSLILSKNMDSEILGVDVCVKRSDQRLTVSNTAFALAHPSMLRRFGFRLYEMAPTKQRWSGYGTASLGNELMESIMRLFGYSNAIIIPNTADVKPNISFKEYLDKVLTYNKKEVRNGEIVMVQSAPDSKGSAKRAN